MKLCFWMLGEPEWTIEQIAGHAKEWGYDGVDLRAARGDDAGRIADLSLVSTDEQLERIRTAFERAGVEVSSLLCSPLDPELPDSGSWTLFEDEIARHAELARKVGAPRLMISPEQAFPPAASYDEYLDRVWQSVARGLDGIPEVTSVVIQNHIGRANAGETLASVERAGDPRFGVEFSCDHVLVMQEDMFALIDRYAQHIHKICFADRQVVRDKEFGRFDGRYFHVRFELAKYGTGIVQAQRMFTELAARGFSGWVGYKCEPASLPGQRMSASADLMAGFPDFVRGLGASADAAPVEA
ncbi:sugar phosphate isomerase/epimerase [Conexibacter sp. CPCC 206217]|uniref:sugar phosphate isomerase/epimerase family protein n=1 Tax=Conexibacter sp. CPCC 206217 TaxID=3064574 RepID=UPI00272609BE|nr:sugar phosphate isomerase/epimerase [Conexibacter sp. CPCC 206217]MDO8213170.1 sugar phosphate isomerase/epimerase [Conexibacter sp. CPCC 206217]